MFKNTCLVFCVVYVIVQARNPDDLKTQFVHYMMECSQKYSLTPSDLEMLRNKQMPNSKSAKCVFACAYEKTGIMVNGYLSVEKLNAMSDMYISEDPEKLRNAKLFAEACQTVNNVDLSNQDNKECERAALIFQCSVEKASQFNFDA